MDKKRKNKFDVLMERSANEYAERICNAAKASMKELGVEMSDNMDKSMKELVTNSFIAGACHMFNTLIIEQTKKPK